MKVAFLFSGQGAQTVGMGKDLYNHYSESRAIFNEANEILGWDVKELCFEDPNQYIHQTRYTQPALFTTSVAALKVVQSQGILSDVVAGFSLGEYTALFASGALSFKQALELVEKRAIYMDEVSKQVEGTMAAILGLTRKEIEQLLTQVDQGIVEIANDNCPGQLVISGEIAAVQQLCEIAKENGAKRALPLKVSGPFHSSLLEQAAHLMAEEIKQIQIIDPVIPMISNVSARPLDAIEIRKNIPIQIKSGVRWRESMGYLVQQGTDLFIEIGVGKTLCGFMNKIDKTKMTCNVDNIASLEKTLEILKGD